MVDTVIQANPGIYALLVSPQRSPETQDFSVLSNWCHITPVVGWWFTSDNDKVRPLGPGYTKDVGSVFLFPDGQVFCLNLDQTFRNLGDYIRTQFEVEPPSEFDTTPTDSLARPPGDPAEAESPSLRSLGVSGRACAPLERMGVETLAQLAVQSRADIAAVKGVATDSVKMMDRLLKDHGLSWDWKPSAAPEPQADDDDEELEDVL